MKKSTLQKKEMQIDSGMTLYDVNKQLVAKLEPLVVEDFFKKTREMVSDMWDSEKKYWMLLCNDRQDYTVFILLTKDGTLNEMYPTLSNRGSIISIEKQEDGNYEIWIRDPKTKENFAYYLFDYTFGIIEA